MCIPKVSIIVPVYNVQQYLEKCIESILNQTERNFEIILVNDGSTDNSANILDQYSKKDKRIKVIHKNNSGVSDTRNIGLQMAKGEYVTFVDADDWISRDMIKTLYDKIVEEKSQFSVCRYKLWNRSNNDFVTTNLHETLKVGNIYDIYKSLIVSYAITGRGIPYGGCGKLFKRSIIEEHNIRFDNKIQLCEDVFFIISYFEQINTASIVDEPFYNVTDRPNSTTKQYYSYELDVHIKARKKFEGLFEIKGVLSESITQLLDIRLIKFYLYILINQFSNNYNMNIIKRIDNTYNLMKNSQIEKLLNEYKSYFNDNPLDGITMKLLLFINYNMKSYIGAIGTGLISWSQYISKSIRLRLIK